MVPLGKSMTCLYDGCQFPPPFGASPRVSCFLVSKAHLLYATIAIDTSELAVIIYYNIYIYIFIYSCIYSYVYSFIHAFIHNFIHLFIFLLIYS